MKKRIVLTSQQRSQAQKSLQKTYLHVEGRFCYVKDVRAQMQLFLLHNSFLLNGLDFVYSQRQLSLADSLMLNASRFPVNCNSSNTKFRYSVCVLPINRSELIFQLSKKSHTYYLFTKHILKEQLIQAIWSFFIFGFQLLL